MNPPRITTQLADGQRRLLARAVTAHKKVVRARSAYEGAVSARDDLIRQTLGAGVGETLIARELNVNRGLIWKIKKGLTTKQYEQQRGGGT